MNTKARASGAVIVVDLYHQSWDPTLRSSRTCAIPAVFRMSEKGYFPLPDIVTVDPDLFKASFPEWPEYVRRCSDTAGSLTRRESGYLVEIAQEVRERDSETEREREESCGDECRMRDRQTDKSNVFLYFFPT